MTSTTRSRGASSGIHEKRSLNILFLTNCSPFPVRDGQTARTYNILKGLAKRSRVHLLSMFESDAEMAPENLRVLESICQSVEMYPAPPKRPGPRMLARVLRSTVSREPYTVWRHHSAAFESRIRQRCLETPFDLVHCDILPIVYGLRRIGNVPCAITDHDVSYLKALRMARQARNPMLSSFLFLEALKLRRLEKRILSRCSICIVVSGTDREILSRLCVEGCFHVVENGVDTSRFRPDERATEKDTLLWLGGFRDYPNREAIHYFLKDIYPAVKRGHPGVRLLAVGGGVTPRLRQLEARDDSIHFSGYVDDVVTYIQKAAVAVVPVLSGSGTRLKILEAMSAGKAVVTTPVGCEGIEAEDGRHLLVADDAPRPFCGTCPGVASEPRPETFYRQAVQAPGCRKVRLGDLSPSSCIASTQILFLKDPVESHLSEKPIPLNKSPERVDQL